MPDSTTTTYTPEPGDTEADIIAALQSDNDRLRAGLNKVREFLHNPGWWTYEYMENSGVYEDHAQALLDITHALGETNDG